MSESDLSQSSGTETETNNIVAQTGSRFSQFAAGNPCEGCEAPCCRMQLVAYKTPTTYMDIDHVRYMLLFPDTEVVVTNKGDWYILKWVNCSKFEVDTFACQVHSSPQQPRICFTYNAYSCWYKRNFTTSQPPELYRLTRERFDAWADQIFIDEKGIIVQAPNYEAVQTLFAEQPITPTFKYDPAEPILAADIPVLPSAAERTGMTSALQANEMPNLAPSMGVEQD